MSSVNFEELLEAGCHFGHLKRKWNPAMAPYIFMEKNGIHIIDLNKTMEKLDEACNAARQIAKSGRKILFVATKKQAKEIVSTTAQKVGMPYVTERWPGGMLTNFFTIRKAVKKMSNIDELIKSPQFNNISKRERLQIQRKRIKLEKDLGSISDLTRFPAAVFIVDIMKEHIALAEARKLAIPTFAIIDTNSNPNLVDFPIPANDDATKSISIILKAVGDAVSEGIAERALNKEAEPVEEMETTKTKVAVEEEDTDNEPAPQKRKRINVKRPVSKIKNN